MAGAAGCVLAAAGHVRWQQSFSNLSGRSIFLLALLLLWATATYAQTNSSAVRLAIISESNESAVAADLLMVELSRQPKLQLLEREQIEKVYREQGLSGGNKNFLQLGQVLGRMDCCCWGRERMARSAVAPASSLIS